METIVKKIGNENLKATSKVKFKVDKKILNFE